MFLASGITANETIQDRISSLFIFLIAMLHVSYVNISDIK